MKYIFQTLITVVLIAFSATAQLVDQPVAQTIPDFTFFKLDKTPFTNKNLEGNKPLFFIFFDASCEHCQRAVQSLNDHYKELKNVAVYLVTLDNISTINNFINKYGRTLYGKKNVTILQDLHNEFISKFKPIKYPSMFLYSSQKKLVDYEDNEASMFRFYHSISATAK